MRAGRGGDRHVMKGFERGGGDSSRKGGILVFTWQRRRSSCSLQVTLEAFGRTVVRAVVVGREESKELMPVGLRNEAV